jgi:hypothetical protein
MAGLSARGAEIRQMTLWACVIYDKYVAISDATSNRDLAIGSYRGQQPLARQLRYLVPPTVPYKLQVNKDSIKQGPIRSTWCGKEDTRVITIPDATELR